MHAPYTPASWSAQEPEHLYKSSADAWLHLFSISLLPYRADMFPIAFVTLLGLTNGHLASMTLMHVPTLQPQIVRDSCSTIMAFSINFGVSMGVLAALVLIPSLQV